MLDKIVFVQDDTDKISLILTHTSNNASLYLGNYKAATDLNLLKSLKISSVLTIGSELTYKYPFHFSHFKINIDDQPLANIYEHLEPSYNFLKKQLSKGNVLVHCKMGISRSASLVISYIMRKYRCSYSQAYGKVKAKRPKINPNEGFVMQLKTYEKKLAELKSKH